MRVIYNTSYIVNDNSVEFWLEFMQQEYIAPIKKLDLCDDILFTKVSIDQDGGKTYSLQLVFDSDSSLENFLENHIARLDEILIARFQNHYLCFSSVLKEC